MLDNNPKNTPNPSSDDATQVDVSPDKKNEPKTDLSKLKLGDIKEIVGSGRFDQSFDREIDRGAERITKTLVNQTLDTLGLGKENTRIQHQEKVRIDFQHTDMIEMELKRELRKRQEKKRRVMESDKGKLTLTSKVKAALAKSLIGKRLKRTLDSFMDSGDKKKLFDLKRFAKKIFSRKPKK